MLDRFDADCGRVESPITVPIRLEIISLETGFMLLDSRKKWLEFVSLFQLKVDRDGKRTHSVAWANLHSPRYLCL